MIKAAYEEAAGSTRAQQTLPSFRELRDCRALCFLCLLKHLRAIQKVTEGHHLKSQSAPQNVKEGGKKKHAQQKGVRSYALKRSGIEKLHVSYYAGLDHTQPEHIFETFQLRSALRLELAQN